LPSRRRSLALGWQPVAIHAGVEVELEDRPAAAVGRAMHLALGEGGPPLLTGDIPEPTDCHGRVEDHAAWQIDVVLVRRGGGSDIVTG